MMTTLEKHLLNSIRSLYKDADDHDVIIEVGQQSEIQTFHAHSVILRAVSPYFKAALSKRWVPERNDVLIFRKPNVSPAIFAIILKYIYNGSVSMSEITENNVASLLSAADELQLFALLEHVQDNLMNKHKDWINKHLIEILSVCSSLESCRKLFQHCNAILENEPHMVLDSDDFVSLEHNVLKTLLSSADLCMDEIEIWNKIITWGTAQLPELGNDPQLWNKEECSKLKKVLDDIIPLMHFTNISSADFCYKIMPYKRVFPKDMFKEIMCFYLDPQYNVHASGKLLPPRKMSINSVDSVLVSDQQAQWICQQIIKAELGETAGNQEYQFNLLYRGTQHGFTTCAFHEHCDNKGPTLAVMQVAGTEKLLGGYSPVSWNGIGNLPTYVRSAKTFIFSMGKHDLKEAVLATTFKPEKALVHWFRSGVSFEDLHTGHDGKDFNASGACSYSHKNYSRCIHSSDRFAVSEYEVFQVIRK